MLYVRIMPDMPEDCKIVIVCSRYPMDFRLKFVTRYNNMSHSISFVLALTWHPVLTLTLDPSS